MSDGEDKERICEEGYEEFEDEKKEEKCRTKRVRKRKRSKSSASTDLSDKQEQEWVTVEKKEKEPEVVYGFFLNCPANGCGRHGCVKNHPVVCPDSESPFGFFGSSSLTADKRRGDLVLEKEETNWIQKNTGFRPARVIPVSPMQERVTVTLQRAPFRHFWNDWNQIILSLLRVQNRFGQARVGEILIRKDDICNSLPQCDRVIFLAGPTIFSQGSQEV